MAIYFLNQLHLLSG